MRTIVCGRWNRHCSDYPETRQLHRVRNGFDNGKASLADLKKAEDETTALLLNQLEDAGVDMVGDGGFRWDSIYDVARKIKGCTGFTQLTRIPKTNHFHRQPVAQLPLTWAEPILLGDLEFAKKQTSRPIVVSLPGPFSIAHQTQNVNEIGFYELAEAYARVLNQEINCLLANGAAMVRIEEPHIRHAHQLSGDVIQKLTENVDPRLLALASWFENIACLDYYFRLPFNTFFLDLVEANCRCDSAMTIPAGKQLVLGLFNARHIHSYSQSEMKSIIKTWSEYVGRERLLLSFHTDPHFLPWQVALEKVRQMVSLAGDSYPATLSSAVSSKATWPLKHSTFLTSAVGSYPQDWVMRKARAELSQKMTDPASYHDLVRGYVELWMEFQEQIDLTVPVGGEFLRQDMAVYFGEQFGGQLLDFVPSYENRRYRPVQYSSCITVPEQSLLLGDWVYAQGLSERPIKETITGPATLADWVVIAHDHYYQDSLAFRLDLVKALRQEISALVDHGCRMIQIDEPALTTKMENFAMDVKALVELLTGFEDQAYFILHICYSDMKALDQAFPKILQLPFQQIHMEMANRNYATLKLIEKYGFGGKDIGLGVTDVHTNRIETVAEVVAGVKRVLPYFKPEQIWLLPDCGLKERSDRVARAKLQVMCEAAAVCRQGL